VRDTLVLDTPLNDAVMFVEPEATVVAVPWLPEALLIVALVVEEEAQVTLLEISAVEPFE
jgi:hypothetical protein